MAVFEEETVDFQNKKKASEEKLGKLIVREDEACSKVRKFKFLVCFKQYLLRILYSDKLFDCL